jgi:hypothetical protein
VLNASQISQIPPHMTIPTRCKQIRKIKITWRRLNGFPFCVLYGKHCWTYGNIIKMRHWCTTTTTFCDTFTIKIFIILWHFPDVIHMFNNSLISYSHVKLCHVLSRFRIDRHRYVAASLRHLT